MNTPANPATLPELLPCPFCGCDVDNEPPTPFPVDEAREWWAARCGNPGCAAEIVDRVPERVAESWNRRAEGIAASRSGAGEVSDAMVERALSALIPDEVRVPYGYPVGYTVRQFIVGVRDHEPSMVMRVALAAANLAGGDGEDAARYRWLRDRDWDTCDLFVVSGGKDVVRLGVDCPSRGRLDAALDAAMKADAARKESDNAR